MEDRERAAEIPPAPRAGAHEPEGAQARARVVDLLLRRPEQLFALPGRTALAVRLACIALGGYLVYGVIVGSFSGDVQWWAAPLKILAGAAACALICFPSLYIFACLSGAEVRPAELAGVLLGAQALTAVLLAGFAPVAWIFSQSSTVVSVIAPIHLILWFASIVASLRVLRAGWTHWKARGAGLVALWLTILILTSLQMMTALRPIVGRSTTPFTSERMFFLQHWARTIDADLHP